MATMNTTKTTETPPPYARRWQQHLHHLRQHLHQCPPPFQRSGRLTRINGLVMEASGLKLPLGASCHVQTLGNSFIEAEVVGFHAEKLYMMPTEDVFGLVPGAAVFPVEALPGRIRVGEKPTPRRRVRDRAKHLPVGMALLGRVIDGAGRALDGLGPIPHEITRPLQSRPYNPLQRAPIRTVLDVGIRAINSLLSVGRGQRMGLMAGSGVGKSVLIGMMARYTRADIIVVGLIGERGREVKEFIEENLGTEGLQRAVVIAAPADTSPLMRLQGAAYATTVAEYFRDQGKQVLLIMDSLTRYAMAQREIALAIGEPPVTRGYPPSVFARLPALVERAGNANEGGGSITAFYTVLAEGDDQQDPIADAARAILDGHIVLSRELADQGHYPAIDIEQSISRALHNLASEAQFDLVRQFKQLFSRYQRSRDLISVGAYQAGADPLLDLAVQSYPRLEQFLQQKIHQCASYPESLQALSDLFAANTAESEAEAALAAAAAQTQQN